MKTWRLFQSILTHFWCLKMWSSMVVFEASHLEIYRKSRSKKLQRSNRKRYMHRSKNASPLLKTSQRNPVVWETHKWTWYARFYHYSRKNAHLCKLSRFRSCSKTTNSLPKWRKVVMRKLIYSSVRILKWKSLSQVRPYLNTWPKVTYFISLLKEKWKSECHSPLNLRMKMLHLKAYSFSCSETMMIFIGRGLIGKEVWLKPFRMNLVIIISNSIKMESLTTKMPPRCLRTCWLKKKPRCTIRSTQW